MPNSKDKKNKPTLNFFRNNDLAYSISRINYGKEGLILPFVYNDYFNMTMDIFIIELRRLENATDCPSAYNPMLLSIFTDIFCLIEQFISTVSLLVYFYCVSKEIPDEKTFNKIFRQDYLKTLNYIFETAQIDSTDFREAKMYNYLKELEDTRNYILHGNVGKIKISKTKLPEVPLTLNIEDIMEELNIMINLIHYIRYMFPNLDLMPNIRLKFERTLIFKKLDEFFYKVLVPYFEEILKKHSLLPTRQFPIMLEPVKNINKTIAKEIWVLFKAIPSEKFDYDMNKERTDFLSFLIFNIVDIEQVRQLEMNGAFQVPKFMLNEINI